MTTALRVHRRYIWTDLLSHAVTAVVVTPSKASKATLLSNMVDTIKALLYVPHHSLISAHRLESWRQETQKEHLDVDQIGENYKKLWEKREANLIESTRCNTSKVHPSRWS